MQLASDLSALTRQLQTSQGPVASALRQLEALARAGRDALGPNQLCVVLLESVPSRAALLEVIAAHGKTRWPGSYGQSPYESAMTVLHAIADGTRPRRGHTRGQWLIYERLFPVLAAPGALARYEMDGGVERRYPHLLSAMRQAAILTHGEAASALRILVRTHPAERAATPAGSEAVAYFGGNLRAVIEARRWWRRQLRTRVGAALAPA